jgi:hypothetical protein
MMALTSEVCPTDRLVRRSDLVVRPLPEIGMCMVYRPRPARIITLNPTSWMLLELCDGATVDAIEATYTQMLSERGRPPAVRDVREGLNSLVDHQLITVCGAAVSN